MIKSVVALSLLASSFLYADGKDVYEKKCSTCHAYYVPVEDLMENFMKSKNQTLKLKAPTINQLSFRLKQMIGEQNADKEFHQMEVIEFISDYVINPDKQKSVCIPEVIDSFETMESMRGKISDEELQSVGMWIYNYTPNKETKQ